MVVEGNHGEVGVGKLKVGDVGTINLKLKLVVNRTIVTKNVYRRGMTRR